MKRSLVISLYYVTLRKYKLVDNIPVSEPQLYLIPLNKSAEYHYFSKFPDYLYEFLGSKFQTCLLLNYDLYKYSIFVYIIKPVKCVNPVKYIKRFTFIPYMHVLYYLFTYSQDTVYTI